MANIASPENPFKVDDPVTYNSVGRPYLNGATGTILQFNTANTSALVKFVTTDDKVYNEWVGFAALDRVNPPNSVEEMLRKELREVNDKFATVSSEYRKLNSRKSQLENALRALNVTFR
jgi:hypothetical protein